MRYLNTTFLLIICSLSLAYADDMEHDFNHFESHFDAIEQDLEDDFNRTDHELENEYKMVDQALEQAYVKFSNAIARKWGEKEVELPSKKVWVDYNNQLDSRRVFDFEKGELTVERIIDENQGIDNAIVMMQISVHQAETDTERDLENKDQPWKYAKKILHQEGIVIEQAPVKKIYSEPVMKYILPQEAAKKINRKTVKKTRVVGKDGKKRTKVTYKVPFTKGHYKQSSKRYANDVQQQAQHFKIPASLILAIMQTESAFNPRARSAVPAYGLMQLVPRSGGMDAYQYVYRQKKLLSPEYLYQASNNVELGTAYLKVLDSRYLAKIKNPESRLYCVIAAYNTGAGNVAKAFIGTTRISKAAKTINTMTPEQVFNHLKVNLPYEETQRYIVKVTTAKKNYAAWD